MKQKVWKTLQTALTAETGPEHEISFAQRINERFKGLGVEAIDVPRRQAARSLPNFCKK